ncbi:unnamed protein product, partial [Closterium sp. Naga37s-1]
MAPGPSLLSQLSPFAMGCCLSSTAVEPSSSSLHAATSASLPPHKHVKDPMLTSATK